MSVASPVGQDLLDAYEHYQGPSTTGFYLLFTVEPCDVCGASILGPNNIRVRISGGDRALRAAHLTPRKPPADEGGWSSLHGCTTCSECCYDDSLERVS